MMGILERHLLYEILQSSNKNKIQVLIGSSKTRQLDYTCIELVVVRLITIIVLTATTALIGAEPFINGIENSKSAKNTHAYAPEHGLVPDEKTAIAIAEAILIPIYGNGAIEKQKPFMVTHGDGEWTVEGTLHGNSLGGTFFVKISQRDAKIITLTHSK